MKKQLILTVILLAASLTTMSFRRVPAPGYKIGDEARHFVLLNVDRKWVSPLDYKDAKGFIIAFTDNHGEYSKMYESRIEALNQQFASKGYPVIAIGDNDTDSDPQASFDEMVERAKAHHYGFPYLYDEANGIAADYGALVAPQVFVLNKENGKMIVRYIGAIDDNASTPKTHYVEDAVNALLGGKPVPTETTNATGTKIQHGLNGC